MKASSTILIVDDEPRVRELVAMALSSGDYRLEFAGDGREGMRLARRIVPDLVLLDVMMPGMTGFEVCEELRADPLLREVPIIFMTALDDRDSKLRGIRCGADEFLTKPLDIHELRARVDVLGRLNRFRRLLTEQQKFRDVVQLAPDAIFILDAELQIRFTNESAGRLFRATDALPLVDVKFPMLAVSEHSARLSKLLAAVRTGNTPTNLAPMEFMRLDGGIFPAALAVGPINWEEEPAIQINLRDQTRQHELESNLIRSQRLHGLGSVAGGVAHDLNNIITPILVAADMLTDTRLDSRDRGLVDRIARAARKGADLVQQILTFASGAGSRMTGLPVKYVIDDLRRLVRDALPDHTRLVTTKLAEDITLNGDPTQLVQMLMNLCINARDAMPEGGEIRLDAMLEPDESTLRIAVADEGPGVPAADLERIWEPFYTSKEGDEGTGLGLSTARAIAERHQGSIEVLTAPGPGATFVVRLPISGHAPVDTVKDVPARQPQAGGETILVCDDDASILETAVDILEFQGYQVITARNGAECLHCFDQRAEEIDAVLCDARIPHIDGLSVLRLIRDEHPDKVCILMSGSPENLAPIAGGSPGVTGLHKPFSRNTVLQVLREQLAKQRAGHLKHDGGESQNCVD